MTPQSSTAARVCLPPSVSCHVSFIGFGAETDEPPHVCSLYPLVPFADSFSTLPRLGIAPQMTILDLLCAW